MSTGDVYSFPINYSLLSIINIAKTTGVAPTLFKQRLVDLRNDFTETEKTVLAEKLRIDNILETIQSIKKKIDDIEEQAENESYIQGHCERETLLNLHTKLKNEIKTKSGIKMFMNAEELQF